MEKIYLHKGLVLIGKVKELRTELAKIPAHQKLIDLTRFNLH